MSAIDEYNPLYEYLKEEKSINVVEFLNLQNLQYGMDKWYPALADNTPQSYILELEDDDIETLAKGEVPTKKYFRNLIEMLIGQGYHFMKTTHVSAHAFKSINKWDDFVEQITAPRVIMSFRRYKCKYICFRKWADMNLECRCYVYDRRVKYMEVYRDIKKEFKPYMFTDLNDFVQYSVIPALADQYKDFTVDCYKFGDTNVWNAVEINSPLWLKCGTYLINYEWEKHRIHETTVPICRYPDGEDEIILTDDEVIKLKELKIKN